MVKIKIIRRFLLTILTLGVVANSQAQINLGQSHNPSKEPLHYIIDFLHVDSQFVQSISFKKNDIKRTKVSDSNIIITTNLLIVLNRNPLIGKKEKEAHLAHVNKDRIVSIVKLDKEEAAKTYGKKGKRGALIVTVLSP